METHRRVIVHWENGRIPAEEGDEAAGGGGAGGEDCMSRHYYFILKKNSKCRLPKKGILKGTLGSFVLMRVLSANGSQKGLRLRLSKDAFVVQEGGGEGDDGCYCDLEMPVYILYLQLKYPKSDTWMMERYHASSSQNPDFLMLIGGGSPNSFLISSEGQRCLIPLFLSCCSAGEDPLCMGRDFFAFETLKHLFTRLYAGRLSVWPGRNGAGDSAEAPKKKTVSAAAKHKEEEEGCDAIPFIHILNALFHFAKECEEERVPGGGIQRGKKRDSLFFRQMLMTAFEEHAKLNGEELKNIRSALFHSVREEKRVSLMVASSSLPV